ncbi:protein involved in sex pheromone biosynthesis [Enterococcus rotai]|uniref:DUF5067 domain-containing protein n=1 Tax=Enterococcus rotai TaxID=118060 RepID=A0A0U2XAP1_9ENTE|nr:DUF5067 domain-containing protein [Enterococcus rotai]ALS37160.1 hypothetical protein ATZ35_08305 [Enterococcus rotai]
MKKKLIGLAILGCCLLLAGCNSKNESESKEKKTDQGKVAKKEVSENNYASADNSFAVNNENFISPDFEAKLTGSSVVSGDDNAKYLVVFYTFTNKTNVFKSGQEVFEKYLQANQASNKDEMETLFIDHPELSEQIKKLSDESTKEQEQGKAIPMATVYKTISDKDLRLDFLDAEGSTIVSKNYLIKLD